MYYDIPIPIIVNVYIKSWNPPTLEITFRERFVKRSQIYGTTSLNQPSGIWYKIFFGSLKSTLHV